MQDKAEASSVPPEMWRIETNSQQEGAMSPPSFAQSEFETIIRRQKPSRGLKILDSIPSRFPHLDNDWEFAGWGSMRYLELSDADLAEASRFMSIKPAFIDQYRASSIAGNGVAGSVFYAFPAVASVAGIFSPISLAVACLMMFLYKPILQELGSAVPLNGANYTYLLQFSGKTLGLIGAASSLLDAAASSTVSSVTAAAYLQGEFGSALPLSVPVLTILLLIVFTLAALFNVRESSIVTLSFTLFHIISMGLLFGFSVAFWGHQGSEILSANWALRPLGNKNIARGIFYGICLGFLAPTGFECTPAYIEVISEADYPFVLRNLLIASLLLNAPLMLLVYVHLPTEEILNGTNVLSLLAERVAGKWLRYLIVVDAVVVLSGGILTGLFTACELLENLATSGILPKLFTRIMPVTGGPVFSATLFLVGCILVFVSSGFSLSIVSNVFSVVFLVVMLLYTLSNMMLKFNRDRLPRRYRTGILTVFMTAALTVVVLIGNIALNPIVMGLFASYFIALLLGLFAIKSQAGLARLAIWLYDQIGLLRKFKRTKGLDALIVKVIRRNRRHGICVFVKGDDIYHLIESVLYVRRNEPTARIIFVHAYQTIEDIPSELGPNVKILDEAFPSITLDLVFLQGTFTPSLVQAASVKMAIPRAQMFMSTPGPEHTFRLADYKGLRVIHR